MKETTDNEQCSPPITDEKWEKIKTEEISDKHYIYKMSEMVINMCQLAIDHTNQGILTHPQQLCSIIKMIQKDVENIKNKVEVK